MIFAGLKVSPRYVQINVGNGVQVWSILPWAKDCLPVRSLCTCMAPSPSQVGRNEWKLRNIGGAASTGWRHGNELPVVVGKAALGKFR